MNRIGIVVALLAASALAGCASSPKSIVHQPTSVRPVPQPEPLYGNGAIFQSNSRGSLFEDRAARQVGDVLTVSIEENLIAKSKSSSNANRSGSLSQTASTPLAAPYLPGVLEKVANAGYKLESANKFDGKGETNAENTFTGNITVTVVEVLANGNLVVSGEKQIAIHNQHEFLRFSGVVSPFDIKPGNQISSTKVADARIEQRASGSVGDVQDAGWLQKLFMAVSPF